MLQVNDECLGVPLPELYPLLTGEVQLEQQTIVQPPAKRHLVVQRALASFRRVQAELVAEHVITRTRHFPFIQFCEREVAESIPPPIPSPRKGLLGGRVNRHRQQIRPANADLGYEWVQSVKGGRVRQNVGRRN